MPCSEFHCGCNAWQHMTPASSTTTTTTTKTLTCGNGFAIFVVFICAQVAAEVVGREVEQE